MMILHGKRVDSMFRLEPFQRQALDAVEAGRDVFVVAPTGAGKTRIAGEIARRLLPERKRAVYASPLKAISTQKFRQYVREFGEENVGILTGDVRLRPEAPVAIMTTEPKTDSPGDLYRIAQQTASVLRNIAGADPLPQAIRSAAHRAIEQLRPVLGGT